MNSTIRTTVKVELTRADGSRTVVEEEAVDDLGGNPRFDRWSAEQQIAAVASYVVDRLGPDRGAPLNAPSRPPIERLRS